MHDLTQIGSAWAEATTKDLTEYFGRGVTLSGPATSEGALAELLGGTGFAIHAPLPLEGGDDGALALVASLATALEIASMQLEEAQSAPDDGELDGRVKEAYRCVVEMCVGLLGRVLDEEAGLPSPSLGDIRTLSLPAEGDDGLPAGDYRSARFQLSIEDGEPHDVDLLIPADLASTWFGALRSEEGEAEDGARVAIMDPRFADSEAFDDLAAALGHELVPIDPRESLPEALEELAECAALILAWDLEGLAGLDVLEQLRSDPRLAALPVVLASESPTSNMVSASLRWGARSFLYKPYDVAEIKTRLLG